MYCSFAKLLLFVDFHYFIVLTTLCPQTAVFFICNTVSFTYCIMMVLGKWTGVGYFFGVYVVSNIVQVTVAR